MTVEPSNFAEAQASFPDPDSHRGASSGPASRPNPAEDVPIAQEGPAENGDDSTECEASPQPSHLSAAMDPEEKRRLLEVEALPLMDLVFSVARRMVGDEARAEDLVQETYLRAFRSIEQYTLGTNCKAWLLTILRSAYIDASRHIQARGGTHEQLPHDVFAPGERTDLPIDAARFMSILDVMVDDDIRDAMLQVPDVYREAFVMVVVAELPYKEAAGVLGVQEGTVKSRVFRACQTLKGKLWSYAVERRIARAGDPAAP
jgi:RNA polymerase sigma-70 factor, ECF subfamily